MLLNHFAKSERLKEKTHKKLLSENWTERFDLLMYIAISVKFNNKSYF